MKKKKDKSLDFALLSTSLLCFLLALIYIIEELKESIKMEYTLSLFILIYFLLFGIGVVTKEIYKLVIGDIIR